MLTTNEIEYKKKLQAAITKLIKDYDIPTTLASDIMGCSQSDVSQIKKGRSVRSNARLEAWGEELLVRCTSKTLPPRCTTNQTPSPVK